MDTKFNNYSAKFAEPETEAAYSRFIADGDRDSNQRVLRYALPIFPCYILLDYFSLDASAGAIAIRLFGSLLCFFLLFGVAPRVNAQRHEGVVFLIVVILGMTINAINLLYADLQDAYFIGLIQGCVFVCFLIRVSFFKTIIAMLSFAVVFLPTAHLKPDASEAGIQTVVLVTMVAVCAIGSYLFQRFRRFDFQKVVIIEEQNAKLSELLEDTKRDNQRKIAALNVLVHFVRTPIHQIAGFSEILVNEAVESIGAEAAENARYIKSATTNLEKSVNGLLVYHRLDETESTATPEELPLSETLDIFCDNLPISVNPSKGSAGGRNIYVDPGVVAVAMQSFARHYDETDVGASTLKISVDDDDNGVIVTIRDDGHILSAAQYEDLIKPLTRMDRYLSQTGDKLSMAMRTVARSLAIVGGSLEHQHVADGNLFIVRFPVKGAAEEVVAA